MHRIIHPGVEALPTPESGSCDWTTQIVSACDRASWNEAVAACGDHDIYHLAEYHRLAEHQGEGDARLFVFREGPRIVAWPLLIRPLSSVPGLGLASTDLKDATSVYGYPGPLSTPAARADEAFMARVVTELSRVAGELRLVSAFSRLNPLLACGAVCRHIGRLVETGTTVSVDLSLTPEERRSKYRHSHRYEIRRARSAGVHAFKDEAWVHFDDFLRLYTDTMTKVEATHRYFFDRDYFLRLRDALGDKVSLFVATIAGEVASAALFTETPRIVQYHLSGSDAKFRKLAPSKLVLDEAASWAKAEHARVLHLGGGLGSHRDSLFQFKAGFSSTRHRFFVWRWIGMPEVYDELVARSAAARAAVPAGRVASEFFPAYRG